MLSRDTDLVRLFSKGKSKVLHVICCLIKVVNQSQIDPLVLDMQLREGFQGVPEPAELWVCWAMLREGADAKVPDQQWL